MSVARLLSAIRGALRGDAGPQPQVQPAEVVPPIPLPSPSPPGWRSHRAARGPYTRFKLSYPRTWHTKSPAEGDALYLEPTDPTRSISMTLSFAASPVAAPQGLLNALELLAQSRGAPWGRPRPSIDRWRDDAWAASWAWSEAAGDSHARPTWVLLVGHDQGIVFVTISGSRSEFDGSIGELRDMVASLRLSPAELLAPEHFPVALCELLNDRRARSEHFWTFSDEGLLVSRNLEVRLWDLYRAYLTDGDLDSIASALDARQRNAIETRWAGSNFEAVRAQLRVVLRRRELVGELPIVQLPVAGELVACPVLDTDDHMTFIPQVEAERWGLTPQQLVKSAVRALDRGRALNLLELKSEDGRAIDGFLMADEDGYDSGRLLCPRIRSALSNLLGGPLIVAVPAAGIVLIARDYAFARDCLGKASNEAYERRPRPLSREVWRWTEQGLEPLVDEVR